MKTLQVTIGVALVSFVAVLAYTLAPTQNIIIGTPVVDSQQSVQVSGNALPTSTVSTTMPIAPKTIPLTKPTPKPTTTPAPKTTPVVTPKPVPTPPPVVDTRCLVAIDGKRYNLTDYRYQHPGGNVFACGTDMSVAFHGQHNSGKLQQIANLVVP